MMRLTGGTKADAAWLPNVILKKTIDYLDRYRISVTKMSQNTCMYQRPVSCTGSRHRA